VKIAYVSNYLPGYHSHVGGAEWALYNTARLAKDKGNDIFFLTLPFDLSKAKPEGGNVHEVSVLENFLPFLKKYIEILKWYVFQHDPVSYRRSLKILKELKPDIVHFGNFQFLTFGVLKAAKKLNIPVFISIYDYWYFCPATTLYDSGGNFCRKYHGRHCIDCLPDSMRFIQKMLLSFRKKIFDRAVNLADKFIVLSYSSKSILSEYDIPEDKIAVIRLANMDMKEDAGSGADTGNYILFMGWLQKRKGLHVLLDAMPKVWEKHKDIKLYILAQNVKWEKDYELLIKEKIALLPKDKVSFIAGRKERGEVKDILKKAKVVAVPEQWENMSPLLVMEAMLYARPVVASRIGGIPEFIEEEKSGFLAENSDPLDFAFKITKALDDYEKAEALGRNARKKAAELLDRDIIAEKLNKEYQDFSG
jgi:glycosyltransferase involved in cell wall biosynthesis